MRPTDDLSQLRHTLRERAICVLIPTYNNVGTIRRVVCDALTYCDDVIVVDDGSNDGTTDELKSIEGITLVSYSRNRGKGYALKRGFREALAQGFAYVITMDGDGQHYASDIPLFLEANKKWPGSLILGGRKLQNIQRSKGSKFANSFANFWFFVVTGRRGIDTQTGFRLYPVRKMYGYQLLTSRYEAELELIVFASWHGVDIHSIPVNVYYPPQEERVSHFRPFADFTRISILNTVLCVLAVVYALPLFILRKLLTALRTLIVFVGFSLLMLLIITPGAWLYMKWGKSSEHKVWRLHTFIYSIARLVIRKVGIPGARFTLRVSDKVDFNKPSMIICNHQSHLDLAYLLTLSPKMIFLTNDWVWNNPLYGYLIHHAEYYPVSMGIDELMPRLASLVNRGYSIAIFPEGTRSADCRIGRFHRGAFYIARQLGLDVVPMFLYGTGRVLQKGKHVLRRGQVYLEVNDPVPNEQLNAEPSLPALTRSFHHEYLCHYEQIANRMEQNA